MDSDLRQQITELMIEMGWLPSKKDAEMEDEIKEFCETRQFRRWMLKAWGEKV